MTVVAYIIQQFNDQEIGRVELDGEIAFLGRSADADLCLKDPGVSRQHCQIKKRKNLYFLTDLNSRNGTYLNNRRILNAWLVDRDEIIIGKFVIKFFDPLYPYDPANPVPDEKRMLLAYEGGHDGSEAAIEKEWYIEINGGTYRDTERVIRGDYIIGSGYNADLVIRGKDIEPVHIVILKYENNLVMINLSKRNNVTINDAPALRETSFQKPVIIKTGPYIMTVTSRIRIS